MVTTASNQTASLWHALVALSPHDDMESLAYTIVELQMGSLPWDNCMTFADMFISKQRWTGEHWTASTDCLKAFGNFLDAVRNRGQALDYARWKEDLCGDSTRTPPGAEAPANFKYDALDSDDPIRRNDCDDSSESHTPLRASELARLPLPQSPGPWPSLSWDWVDLRPRSTWSGPITLEEEATFGDELELVLRELALIDQPPTPGASLRLSVWDPPEVMKRFNGFSDGRDGGTVERDSGSGDGFGGRNGSGKIDGGYGSDESKGSDGDRVQLQDNGITHEEDLGGDPSDNSDFVQFYDPEYDSH